MPLIYRQLIVYTIFALLSACANVPRISPEQRAQLEQPARQFMALEAWPEAAIAWQQAANQVTGDLATNYRLNAAQAMLKVGDGEGARKIVTSLGASLRAREQLRRNLILAEADLLVGNAEGSLQKLGPGAAPKDRNLRVDYYRLRAEALLIMGQPMASIRERSILESFLVPGPALYRNRQQIWTALTQLNDVELQSIELLPPNTFSGWIALAKLVRYTAQDVEGLELGINDWNLLYPAHPAGDQIVPQILEQAIAQSQPPAKIALLLPLTGPFKTAAVAIRDGLLSAWFADAPNPHRPEIIFRDSSSGDIANTYLEAIASGAEFIIGPLAKNRVAQLLNTNDLQVPILTLNYPQKSPANSDGDSDGEGDSLPGELEVGLKTVYQFALAPEDEAIHAAEHAFAAGHRRAGVIAPQGAWGERTADAFKQAWERLGGVIVSQDSFPDQANELSNAVKRLLNFDQSEDRARRLRRVLARKIKHDAEPRTDLDVIFLVAYPQEARQIKPLLLFFRAANVPVVATSHVYSGVVDANADQDLNGIEFADMPWILSPDDYGLPSLIQSLWPNARGAIGRLYAFGADAYSLVSQLGSLRTPGNPRVQGLTGELWIGEQGRIQRELQWRLIDQGVPSLIQAPQ